MSLTVNTLFPMANNRNPTRTSERTVSPNSDGIFYRIPASSTDRIIRDVVTLHNPRPKSLRTANNYVSVNNQPNNLLHSRGGELLLASSPTLTDGAHPLITIHQQPPLPPRSRATVASFSSFDRIRTSDDDRTLYKGAAESSSSPFVNNVHRVQTHAKLSSISLPQTSKLATTTPTSNHQRTSSTSERNLKALPAARLISKPKPANDANVIITSQPTTSSSSSPPSNKQQQQRSYILCPRCNKCRCDDCATPKELPSAWIGKYCLCSADKTVDVLSCMCCIKGCLYHLGGEDKARSGNEDLSPNSSKNGSCNDEDSEHRRHREKTCASRKCCLRWTLVGAGTAALSPCLLCYLPLKGCSKLASCAYARYHDYGCRCADWNRSSSSTSAAAVNGVARQLTWSSKTLPPPFPDSNFHASAKLTSESGEPTTRHLFTIQKTS